MSHVTEGPPPLRHLCAAFLPPWPQRRELSPEPPAHLGPRNGRELAAQCRCRSTLRNGQGSRGGLRAGLKLGVSCVLNRVDSRWGRQGNAACSARTPRRAPCSRPNFPGRWRSARLSSGRAAQRDPASPAATREPSSSAVFG